MKGWVTIYIYIRMTFRGGVLVHILTMNSDKVIREQLVETVSRYRQANHARHMQRYVKCCARRASEEIVEQTTVEEFLEDTPCEFEVLQEEM
mgnify:FL=1